MSDQFPPDLPPDEAAPTSGERPDAPKGFGNGPEPKHTENAAEAELRTLEAEIRALEAEIEAEEQALDPATRRAVAKLMAKRAANAATPVETIPAPSLEVADFAGLAEPFRHVTDAASLAAVLNAALLLDVAENPRHKAKPVSARLLNYYTYHKQETRYRTFQIPKKTPGETRTIKAPDRGLLRLQRLLLACLTAAFGTSHPASHGFVPGRSILTNAQPHAGRRFVLNLDLCDFFPSTSVGRVVAVLQLPPFGLCKAAAYLVYGSPNYQVQR